MTSSRPEKLLPHLSKSTILDLGQIDAHCRALAADIVLIGAVAFQYHFPQEHRHTSDIDVAVALDLDDFELLGGRLAADGWTPQAPSRHRWQSKSGTLLDLLPAGPRLRHEGKVVWPGSTLSMTLTGFGRAFANSKRVEAAHNLQLNLVDIPTLLILKMVAFLDSPERRMKDLSDIRAALTLYEADNVDRLFSDEIFEAGLSDVRWAGAYLLGSDLRATANAEEAAAIRNFLAALSDRYGSAWRSFRDSAAEFGDRTDAIAGAETDAFECGFRQAQSVNSHT